MSLTIKLIILAAVLLGDLVAAIFIVRNALARGEVPQAVTIGAAMFFGWVVLAVVLFAFL